MSVLREYQQRSIAALRACYAAGHRAPVLVLPTGSGKTVCAAEMIRLAIARKNRVLFLVHRQELQAQSVSKLEAAGIIVNENTIPFDTRTPVEPSGLRLGSAPETTRGKKEKDFRAIARKIDSILRS